VIQPPGTDRMNTSPGDDTGHDPAEESLGTGRRQWFWHGRIVGRPSAAAGPARKGPRNGPGPRGAENLNRFRERLDGSCAWDRPVVGGRLPCLRRRRAGWTCDPAVGLQAGGR
jgi:hypothetical protein